MYRILDCSQLLNWGENVQIIKWEKISLSLWQNSYSCPHLKAQKHFWQNNHVWNYFPNSPHPHLITPYMLYVPVLSERWPIPLLMFNSTQQGHIITLEASNQLCIHHRQQSFISTWLLKETSTLTISWLWIVWSNYLISNFTGQGENKIQE